MEAIANGQKRMEEFVVGGSTGGAIGGIAALVLSIIGLAGVMPTYMLVISAIVLGTGMLKVQVGITSKRVTRLRLLLSDVSASSPATHMVGSEARKQP